jgi:hypothetical protein
MKNVFIIVLLFFSSFVKGQTSEVYKGNFIGNWLIDKVETLDSVTKPNDLGTGRIQLMSNAYIEKYRGNPLNIKTQEIYRFRYAVVGQKLQIGTEPISDYLIEKCSNEELVFSNNQTRYFFKRMIIDEKNRFYVIGKDTSNKMESAYFDGDIIKYFTTDYEINQKHNSSFIVKASFNLTKNKQIENIVIDTTDVDPIIINKTRILIESSRKKWEPAININFDKIDSKVNVLVMFKSSELKNWKGINHYEIGSKIYASAISFQQNNQDDKAEILYSECISLYLFVINTYGLFLRKELNNAIFNRSAIRIKKGEFNEACNDFKLIKDDKDDVAEAKIYIKQYCK